ncbi:glycine-rich domain-containing protein-like [Halomonas sp. I5-271120]|uniref:glycine-rich domain-containing protein n=1 Tax=Halomonas sp. I5-271120 TaxID=3061632 RepID=UPI0027144ECC|nr:glycine-rich domain-containing protein-like [Halomonas sp. I5-271120]
MRNVADILDTLPHDMTTPSLEDTPSIEYAVEHINAMDFSALKGKLTQPDPTVSRLWESEEVDVAVQYYKNFLYLNKKYLDVAPVIVPSIEVDEVWHHHILDTRRYFADTYQIFGYYFHHFPYFGMRGEADHTNLVDCFEATQQLHELEFGERMRRIWA